MTATEIAAPGSIAATRPHGWINRELGGASSLAALTGGAVVASSVLYSTSALI
jgi:hypothetical protein